MMIIIILFSRLSMFVCTKLFRNFTHNRCHMYSPPTLSTCFVVPLEYFSPVSACMRTVAPTFHPQPSSLESRLPSRSGGIQDHAWSHLAITVSTRTVASVHRFRCLPFGEFTDLHTIFSLRLRSCRIPLLYARGCYFFLFFFHP